MVGHYSKPAPEAPRVVQWVDRLNSRRRELAIAAAAVLLILVALSIFMPTLGLMLLVLAAVAMLGLYIIMRSRAHYETHWTRDVARR